MGVWYKVMIHLHFCSDNEADQVWNMRKEVEQLRKKAQKLDQEVCMCVFACLYMCVYLYVCVHVYMYVYVCMWVL